MATVNLLINAIAAASPFNPPPTDYVMVGSAQAKTNGTLWAKYDGSQQSCWAYDHELVGDVVTVEIQASTLAAGTSHSQGVFLYNSATGLGIQLFHASTTELQLRPFTSGTMSTVTTFHTFSGATLPASGVLGMRYTKSTNTIQATLNGADYGSPYTAATVLNTRGGFCAFSYTFTRGVTRFTATFSPVYEIVDINGASDIERGETGVTYSTLGFSSITTGSTDESGVTVGSISDTVGDGTFNVSGYVDGSPYPQLPASVLFTLGDGTNSASLAKTITILPSESSVVTSGMITTNSDFLGYHFAADGRSVADGGQIVWPTTAGLTIYDDGSYILLSGNPIDLDMWYRDPSNSHVYFYSVTIGGGLTSSGLTVSGLTSAGLTVSGLTSPGL